MMLKRVCFFSTLVLLFFACGKDVPVPAYITVNKFTVLENTEAVNEQGELNNNFTDAWVYIDGDLKGVFELPVTLPIGQEGQKKITVIAGVRNNGISATKVRYPFVQNYEVNVTLSPKDTTIINPTTSYYPNLSFWIEDFEDPTSVSIEESGYSLAHLTTIDDPAILKYGAYFGLVNLSVQDSLWQALTSQELSLSAGSDVYLEIDYYATNNVLTGLTAFNVPAQTVSPNPYIQLNAEDGTTVKWKKIYIDLHEIVDYEANATYFKIALSAVLPVDLKESAMICIDNIKVIHN